MASYRDILEIRGLYIIFPDMACFQGIYFCDVFQTKWALHYWNYLSPLKMLNFKQHLQLAKRKTNWHVARNVGYCPMLPPSAIQHLWPPHIHNFNPLNPKLNPICYLLALLAHHFLHVSRIRVKSLTIRLLMSYIYIYGAPILDVSRSHTTTQHSR